MIKNELEKLGFTTNLSTVYLKLFELGKTKAGEIINQTGLHRSVVYAALDELVERELISKFSKRGVNIYSANNPAKLVDEAKTKLQTSEKLAREIKKRQEQTPREILVSEGLDAIMRATDRSILATPGETMYVLGASQLNVQTILAEHWKKYHKKRIKNGVKFRGLYDQTVDQSFVDYRNSIELSESRFLPDGLEMPVWFNVCMDVVSIMVPEDDPPLVFTIRSQATADAIRKYFKYLWSLSSKTKQKS